LTACYHRHHANDSMAWEKLPDLAIEWTDFF